MTNEGGMLDACDQTSVIPELVHRLAHMGMSKAQLIEQILQMNYRLKGIEREVAGVRRENAGLRLARGRPVRLEKKHGVPVRPPFKGLWKHENGLLACDHVRVAIWKCDSRPHEEYRDLILQWICDELNVAALDYETSRALASSVVPPTDTVRSAANEPVDVGHLSQAACDVIAERRRQVSVEGWTPEHDDEHHGVTGDCQLPLAAAAYAVYGCARPVAVKADKLWPWDFKEFKPVYGIEKFRYNYVRAAALLLAEIERIDRSNLGVVLPKRA